MNMDALRAELSRLGVGAADAHGRIVVLRDMSGADDVKARRQIVAAARKHGFSNVCLELDANVSGD